MSAHFQRREFACPHCRVALVVPRLTAALEQLRAIHGRPLTIVSGYRCPVHNTAVHGALDSQHMYGCAADLEVGAVLLVDAEAVGFQGIGSVGKWARHVDVRDGPRARWSYGAG